jgi:hypothetical protein
MVSPEEKLVASLVALLEAPPPGGGNGMRALAVTTST